MGPMTPDILRLPAFTDRPDGGNPAGVVLDASGLDDERMLALAAEVGFSETAFAAEREDGDLDVRYFSPVAGGAAPPPAPPRPRPRRRGPGARRPAQRRAAGPPPPATAPAGCGSTRRAG